MNFFECYKKRLREKIELIPPGLYKVKYREKGQAEILVIEVI